MLKRSFIVSAVATCLSVGLWAQAQQNPAPTTGTTPKAATHPSTTGTMVHMTGCVFPKRAMSSTKPVSALPAGSVEDYVLIDTKTIAGSAGASEDAGPVYKLEQVAQDQLRDLLGKRVGVTGRVEDKPELPRLQVVSIREIFGVCGIPGPRS